MTRPTLIERRNARLKKAGSVSKQRCVVGNAKETWLSTVDVKLTKDPQVTKSDIKNHLHGQLGLDIEVETINTKYNIYAIILHNMYVP